MTTCNATDALLRVAFNVTQDAWDSSRSFLSVFYSDPFLQLKQQGEKNPKKVRYDYESFADLTDHEACVPRDECSEIVVGGLPTDVYKVSFDGKAVDIGHEFPYDGMNPVTSTEVGTCTVPVCNDAEALLEILIWHGSVTNSFRILDKDSNIVLDGTAYAYESTLTKNYACLPKDDACYTFLIGGAYQYDNSHSLASSYSVIYDGTLVRSSDSWLFDSVQFGDSCELPCNPEDESHVEFFMYDGSDGIYTLEINYEYEWSLSSPSATLSGVVPQGPDNSPFVYMSKCIPKGSCASFNIVAPTEGTNKYTGESERTYNLSPTYSLIMDNVTYRKEEWWPLYSGRNQTTNMGSCTVADLCDEETQDLFHLELQTQAANEITRALFPNVSLPLPAFSSSSMSWKFGDTYYDESEEEQYLLRDSDYITEAYDLDKKYGVIECVPKDGCDLKFYMTPSSPVESYTVKKNGIQLDDVSRTIYDGSEQLQTPFGQNCIPQPSNSLPGIGIAHIMIACVVGHTLLGLV